jgi:hypothetical protein
MVPRSPIRVTLALVMAASLPLLTQCEPNERGACDATLVAFTLPSPGDEVRLRVFVCGEDAENRVDFYLGVEMEGPSEQVMVTVDGGANGFPNRTTPASCETGIAVTLTHLDEGGVLTGVLDMNAQSSQCEINVEAP